MNTLTNEQLKAQIAQWQKLISKAGIKLPSGQPLPDKFFHVFLGVGESTFKKMICGKDSIREIQKYTTKTVQFINRLEQSVFLDEVEKAIPEYITSQLEKKANT